MQRFRRPNSNSSRAGDAASPNHERSEWPRDYWPLIGVRGSVCVVKRPVARFFTAMYTVGRARGDLMTTLRLTFLGAALAGLVIVLTAQQPKGETILVDTDDIGGVVTSS